MLRRHGIFFRLSTGDDSSRNIDTIRTSAFVTTMKNQLRFIVALIAFASITQTHAACGNRTPGDTRPRIGLALSRNRQIGGQKQGPLLLVTKMEVLGSDCYGDPADAETLGRIMQEYAAGTH